MSHVRPFPLILLHSCPLRVDANRLGARELSRSSHRMSVCEWTRGAHCAVKTIQRNFVQVHCVRRKFLNLTRSCWLPSIVTEMVFPRLRRLRNLGSREDPAGMHHAAVVTSFDANGFRIADDCWTLFHVKHERQFLLTDVERILPGHGIADSGRPT